MCVWFFRWLVGSARRYVSFHQYWFFGGDDGDHGNMWTMDDGKSAASCANTQPHANQLLRRPKWAGIHFVCWHFLSFPLPFPLTLWQKEHGRLWTRCARRPIAHSYRTSAIYSTLALISILFRWMLLNISDEPGAACRLPVVIVVVGK